MSVNKSSAGVNNTDQVDNGRTVQSGDAGNDKNVNQHEQREVNDVEINTNEQSLVRDNSVEYDKMCANCHRHQIKSSDCDELNMDADWLTFKTCLLINTGARTKFRTIPRRGSTGNTASRELCLCSQCYNYLTLSDDELKEVTALVVWPSFLWFALKNKAIQDVYGDIMWRFIPNNMRRWWLDSIDIFIASVK